MEKLIIIGAGGAGFTAGIYAGRYALSPIVIGANEGGMITENPIVENFPGYKDPTSGFEIMQDIKKQAELYGARYLMDMVKEITPIDKDDFSKGYKVITNLNGEFQTKSLILAIGTEKNKLNVKGENEFFGKGVSYCATCDGFFYRGKITAVVGGGDTAFIEALYLANICEKVYLIHRRDTFRAEPIRVEKAKNNEKIEFITNATVEEVYGTEKVEGIKINKNGTIIDKKIDGFFVAIGMTPNKVPGLDNYLEKDDKGYIKVNKCMGTNLPGVFAAGDCTTGSCYFRQLITACGEGAIAAESAFKYISKN